MRRREFLEGVGAGAALWALARLGRGRDALAADRPNIVYVNADDLGWTDLGCQGSTYYETPNIDRLASEGVVFTNACAPAANCAPSRACCISGQYGPRHGIYTVGSSERGASRHRKLVPTENVTVLPDGNVTVAEALKAAGYVTCHAGKWHLGPDPRTQGFDVNIAGCDWGHPHKGYFSPYGIPRFKDGPRGEYLTDRLADEAIAFLRANRDRPFFLHFATYTVHTPLNGKPEKVKKYGAKKGSDAHGNSRYAAMVEGLDENVGRLLGMIDELGLRERTLVLFTSDNGGVYKISRQWPLRAGKGSYYEGGIREPLIVRWPGKVAPGRTCDVPVIGIDFYPTFLEAAGARRPAGKLLDGVSLVPLLTGKGAIPDRPLFWHFPVYLQDGNSETRDPLFRTRPGSVVRHGDWKLHEYFEDGGRELYNLREDPGEKRDLAARMPDKTKELAAMLAAWRRETNAPVPTKPNPQYRP